MEQRKNIAKNCTDVFLWKHFRLNLEGVSSNEKKAFRFIKRSLKEHVYHVGGVGFQCFYVNL